MKRFYRELLIVLISLIAITAIWGFINGDLLLHSKLYSQESGWFLKYAQPWRTLYLYGNIPALILAFGAIALLVAGLLKQPASKYRKLSLLLILVMLIAPGILINAVFKDHWGRPRPR
ncbi:MAG: hypothetical protein K8S56_05350, partial [Candidatus Cloacimonetes bacterium]|nr:hypothetical protein [Candidatus Cloacimonadota bacterium]